jgi:hypothetical protein
MNIARNPVQLLAGVAFLTTAFYGVSHGQQFPEVFHGVWIVSVAEDSACKASDWDKHENDGLFRVDAREARYWESSCSVTRMRPSPWDGGPTVDVTMTCGGEGEVSSSREIWSVVDIGSRKALVMTQLEASASVPASKKLPPMRRALGARVYLVCE